MPGQASTSAVALRYPLFPLRYPEQEPVINVSPHHDNHHDDGDGQDEVGVVGHRSLELGVAAVEMSVVAGGAFL